MAKINDGFVLKNLITGIFESGDRLIEIGEASFTGTGATVEVSTDLSAVDAVFLLPKSTTYNANDLLSSDGVVTSGAVTVARNATGGTSGLTFYYMFIGRRWD